MEAFCDKILREKDAPTMPAPEDRHIRVAIAAFEGKTIGEIRVEYPKTSIRMIAESIRTTRDAIRRGQAPEIIKEQFPALIQEQKAYRHGGPSTRPTALGRAVAAIRGRLEVIRPANFREFLDTVRQEFAPIAVPLTVQKILEGVEGGDPTMIKLSTEVFHLSPKKGGLNQQINISPGQGAQEPKRSTNPERRATFFEEIVRRQRALIDGAAPAATIEVLPEQAEDESGDDDD